MTKIIIAVLIAAVVATGGYYACNIYDKLIKEDSGLKTLEQKKHDAKNELTIYAFYYERFVNHLKAK